MPPASPHGRPRALALDVAREMPGTHEGRLSGPSLELERRRLAAYRRTLARRRGGA